jgi:hypothetical protein
MSAHACTKQTNNKQQNNNNSLVKSAMPSLPSTLRLRRGLLATADKLGAPATELEIFTKAVRVAELAVQRRSRRRLAAVTTVQSGTTPLER